MMYQIMNQNELQGDVKYLIHKVQRYCLGLKPLMCLFASLINNVTEKTFQLFIMHLTNSFILILQGCESPITTG